MKQVLLLSLFAFTLFSCRKSNHTSITSIEGNWRMIKVKHNSSGIEIPKPSSVTGDVDITFRHTGGAHGIYNGRTPTNTIMDNNFSLDANRRISISSLAMTKVMENQWGLYFVLHIVSAEEYRLTGDELEIRTQEKTLTFQRI